MTLLTTAKLAAATVGVMLLAWGMRADEPTIRWVGIAFLAAAFLLRFAGRVREPPEDGPERS